MISQGAQCRDKVYCLYALYLLVTFGYFFRGSPEFLDLLLGAEASVDLCRAFRDSSGGVTLYSKMELTLSMTYIATYSLFVQHFLELKRRHVRLNRILNRVYALLGLAVLVDWGMLATLGKSKLFELALKFVLVVPAVYFFRETWRLGRAEYRYILAGSIALLGGAMVSGIIFSLSNLGYDWPLGDPYIPFQLGVLAEVGFFNTGLAYRSRQIEKAGREKDLLLAKRENENQQLKIKQMELDHITLKAQIHPHLILNCLSTISLLIRNGESAAAQAYLEDLSRFLQKNLEQANVSIHSLKNELELVEAYVRVASRQFHDTFTLSVDIPPHVDTTFIRLPCMILQPLAENAIKHGLQNRKGMKILAIGVMESARDITIYVEDNGIGRAMAQKLQRQKRVLPSTSIGLGNIIKRLEIFEQLYGVEARLSLTDRLDMQLHPAGTRAEIKIRL